MSEPITPDEVTDLKVNLIPSFVIDAANRMIAKRWRKGQAKFTMKELLAEIEYPDGWDKSRLYREDALDIEDVYRKKGWDVKYDKPGYCENYVGYWVFSKKK